VGFVLIFLCMFIFKNKKNLISLLILSGLVFSSTVFAAGEPSVTASVSNISYTSATLNIEVTDQGSSAPTTVGFEWGLTDSYGASATEAYDSHNMVYSSQFGTQGSGNGQFAADSVRGLVTDSSGNIFVVDSTLNRIQKFNSSGVYQSQFGSTGSGNGQFTLAYVIAIDSSDNLYVGDYSGKRVQKFNSSGVYQMKFGTSGSGDGQFNSITGIYVDSSGNIYVSDATNDRVQKFDSSGNFLMKFGSPGTGNGQFSDIYGIAVDDDGYIYVVDYNGYRIQKFNSSGVYVSQWGSSGTANGQFNRPTGIAIDDDGDIYISEYSGNRVQKFDSNGTYLAKFGSSGTGNGQFATAFDVDIDPSGNIYVSDQDNQRVQKFIVSPVTTYSENISGLIPNTTYHYRTYATNSNGTTYSDDAVFTTLNFTEVPNTPGSAVDLATASDTGTITNDNYTDDITPTFTGACSYNELVKIYVSDIPVIPTQECSNNTFSITLTNAINSGSQTIKYTLTNTIGESAKSPALTIYVYETSNLGSCTISGLIKPHGPNGIYDNKLYIAQYQEDNVAVIDLATNQIVDHIQSGDSDIYLNFIFRDKMYIINNNGYYNPGSVTIYDLDNTSSPLNTIELGNDTMWMQDVGTYYYIFNRHAFNPPATISVLDKNTNTLVTTITVGEAANRGTLVGNKFYVSNHHESSLSVIDVTTNTVIDTINVDPDYNAFGPSASLVVGTKLYAANWDAGDVAVVDTGTDTLITNIDIEGSVASSLSYYDGKIYVNERHGPAVTIIDTNTDTVTGSFNVIAGGYSSKVFGGKLYFVNQDSEFVSVYDPSTNQVIKHIFVGVGPHSINEYNGYLYVNNFTAGSISIIDPFTNTTISSCIIPTSNSSSGGAIPVHILQAMSDAMRTEESKKNQSTNQPVANNSGNSNKEIISPVDNQTKLSCPVFSKYIKYGERGEEVKLWQAFLNKELNKKIPLTGYMGPMTFKAVKDYQSKNFDKILKPWGLANPTGRIYQTTRFYANLGLGCPEDSLKLDNGIIIK